MNNTYTSSLSFKDYMTKTYSVVALGLLVSTLTALLISSSYTLLFGVLRYSIILVLAELGVAIFFNARLMNMKKSTAYICYFLYSFLTGLTLSVVVLTYASSSVVLALAGTTILFVCMSIIGRTTNVDLTKYSSIISVGLSVMLITTLLNNLLIHSSFTDMLVMYAMVIIFLVLIAMDNQQLIRLYNSSAYNDELKEKLMIMGAFQLYLDFINLFIRVLEIFGKRRDD